MERISSWQQADHGPADTKAKTADFKMNIKAKAVKLVMTEAVLGYGSAGEIRLLSAKDGYKDLPYRSLKIPMTTFT